MTVRVWSALSPVACLLVALLLPAAASAAKGGQTAEAGEKQFYVSLGDSYAVGYQPAPGGGLGSATTDGYANKLPKIARKRGYRLKLVNFGCGGESTTSILERATKCLAPAVGGPDYEGRTQAEAAERFIRKHRRDVAVITVSIGGNDVTACANAENPLGCVGEAVPKIKTNLSILVQRLRAAAGPKPEIVGLTYPDVLLGLYVRGNPDLAGVSVVAFREFINPALKEVHETVQGIFVDVTAATDAYVPLEQTTVLAPYGEIPVAVATVCRISWYCELGDIHLKASGYLEMARLVGDALPKRKKKKK